MAKKAEKPIEADEDLTPDESEETESPSLDVVEGEDQPYQTLYRKYRPQTFDEVIGQEAAVEVLRKSIKNNRIGHAYLFTGPRGTGKTTQARIFGRAIATDELDENLNPVDVNRADLGIVEVDAASNNSVDNIRELIEQTYTSSAVSKRKVFIVDEVHMLSNAASNAFLKTLEEPPANVVFILCTTNPEKVLSTIRSRTQQIRFHLLSPSELTELVHRVLKSEGVSLSDTTIARVVAEGKGSPRDTLSALERVINGGEEFLQGYAQDISRAIGLGSVSDLMITIATAIKDGQDVQTLAMDLLGYWRDCMLALQAPDLLAYPDEVFNEVEQVARILKPSRIFRLLSEVADAAAKMNLGGDPRLLLEVTLVRAIKPDVDAQTLFSIDQRLSTIQADIDAVASAVRGGRGLHASDWPGVDSDAEDEPASASRRKPEPEPEPEPQDEEPDLDEADEDEADEDQDGEPQGESKPKKDKKGKKPKKDRASRDDEAEPEDESDADWDEILQTIHANASKRLQVVLADATIVTRESNSETLVIKVTERLTDAQFDQLDDLVKEFADGRKMDLIEPK